MSPRSAPAGYLIESLTDGHVPYFVGATGLTILIVIYVCLGGMRSVALTDMLQGVLMFTLMIAAVLAVASAMLNAFFAHSCRQLSYGEVTFDIIAARMLPQYKVKS